MIASNGTLDTVIVSDTRDRREAGLLRVNPKTAVRIPSSTGGMAAELAITAGMITFFLSLFGALAGRKLGKKTGDRAEYFGGAVLFLIAAKIIVSAVS